MPELPEVETIRKDLEKEILGAKIVSLEVLSPKVVRPSAKVVKEACEGKTITGFKRRGKLLILGISSGNYLLIHLKLTGRLLVRKSTDPFDKWTRVVFKLKEQGTPNNKCTGQAGNKEQGLELRFTDLRMFGYIKLADEKELKKTLSDYGPEPLDDLSLEKFREILSGSKVAIKKLLMDQKKISGIGNIYANEALWMSKIHPEASAISLTAEQSESLFGSIEKVLKEALKNRGTTATDDFYRDAYGKEGKYQSRLLVYQKEGQICPRCKTPIKRIELGGRGTFFCPKCQLE